MRQASEIIIKASEPDDVESGLAEPLPNVDLSGLRGGVRGLGDELVEDVLELLVGRYRLVGSVKVNSKVSEGHLQLHLVRLVQEDRSVIVPDLVGSKGTDQQRRSQPQRYIDRFFCLVTYGFIIFLCLL
jgi:hypothetical protein